MSREITNNVVVSIENYGIETLEQDVKYVQS